MSLERRLHAILYCLLQDGDDDEASEKTTRQHHVSFDATLEREQGASEPRTRGVC